MVRYCPQCGTPTVLQFDGGRDRDMCPACGWKHYADTGIGVGALILRGEQVLLVERGIPPVGRWTLPSGWIEQDDNLATAVVREVVEETGIDCTPSGIICVRNIPKPERNEMYICFLCEAAPNAEPVPDGIESTRAEFVHPNDFDRIDISAFSRYVIEHYLQQRPQPWPLTQEFMAADAYPSVAVFAPF